MKKWRLPFYALLLGICICFSRVENANAYFTTYVTAKGGYEVSWKHEEIMEETFEDWNKYVKIHSKEGSIPVYVRVKAFAGSKYQLIYSGEDWEWNEKDGYYYYKKILSGGETTTALRIGIEQIPVKPELGENFNVIVIYETLPVRYGADGVILAPETLDWSEVVEHE